MWHFPTLLSILKYLGYRINRFLNLKSDFKGIVGLWQQEIGYKSCEAWIWEPILSKCVLCACYGYERNKEKQVSDRPYQIKDSILSITDRFSQLGHNVGCWSRC